MLDTEPIEIWRVALDRIRPDNLGAWREVLSQEEQSRADSFRGDDHRREYVLAHLALRIVLGRRLGVSPEQVRFVEGSFAANGMHAKSAGRSKPALAARGTTAALGGNLSDPIDLRFNLSHTRGAALIGVAVGRELGVDIERERPMEDLEAMSRSVMSAQEWEIWRTIRPVDQQRAFYRLWTRKEAYLKAIGLGLFRSLQAVSVPVTPEALDSRNVHAVEDDEGTGAWRVMDVEHSPEFAAAVSFEGEDIPLLLIRDLDLLDRA